MLEYRFFHPTEVRYGDLDPQGHLNNAKVLTYFEQARVRYWTQLGLFSKDQNFTEFGVIVADVRVRYEAPVHWGSPIKVGVCTSKVGNKSMTIDQCLVDELDGRVYATGTAVLVAYDYVQHQTMRVPDAWRERLERYEGRALS